MMSIAVFTYDFPHHKTRELLLKLWLSNLRVRCVIAAPRVELNLPPSSLRVNPNWSSVEHPAELARRLGIPYHVLPHDSQETRRLLQAEGIDLGVIGGARILGKEVLETPRQGIINVHPGLIPEVRGLDALKWALHLGQPIGVTVHFIDARVDAGWVISRKEISLQPDDTFVDISIRLEEAGVSLMCEAIQQLGQRTSADFPHLSSGPPPNTVMPADLESTLPEKLAKRLSQLTQKDPR